ncbi:MAG: ABC transporter permease [Candidatus Gracilibacteria bacterium]|jgi:putative ABC transport system permease protein|nr:ABC transporter permease [Candidatus Gracilibacteria bacterium]
MIREILKMSLTSMKENSLRSSLTTLGIIIGTAIIIIVLSVGAGIESLILNQLSSITPETIFVEVQVPSTQSGLNKDSQTSQSIGMGVQIKTMKNKDIEDIKKLPNVDFAYGMLISQSNLQYGSKEKVSLVWGTGAEHAKSEGLKFSEGRFLNEKENDSSQKVVVLGATIKEKLFGSAKAYGKSIKLKNQNYRVVGVVESQGTQFFLNLDEIVYIPVKTVQNHIMGIDYLQAISIKLKNKELITGTISQIKKVLRTNHDIKDPSKDDFAVRTLEESMEIVDTVTGGITILLFCLAFISIVVGGVGIMNVMFVAVTERTKEIGLKKAIGAKPIFIKLQFLSEALIICLVGAIFGIIIGIFITWLISFIASLFNFSWPFIISIFPVFLGIFVSVFTGIIFGYSPANKASKLDPIKALRS